MMYTESNPALHSVAANLKPYLLANGDYPLFTPAVFLLFILLTVCACSATSTQSMEDSPKFDALVFTKTGGFRHQSIPDGITAIQSMGNEHNFRVEASEDATVFTDDKLANYRVVIFLNTTGDILNSEQQAAFERFIQKGGGFVGIHSATDTEYDWPWYGRLVGAYFANHPAIQPATLKVVDSIHESTRSLPVEWVRTDEWYNFREDPSSHVKVLIQIDEMTYSGGNMGESHPISWYHEYDGGRAWYTAMGHTEESYKDPLFLAHVLGGIIWAVGATETTER